MALELPHPHSLFRFELSSPTMAAAEGQGVGCPPEHTCHRTMLPTSTIVLRSQNKDSQTLLPIKRGETGSRKDGKWHRASRLGSSGAWWALRLLESPGSIDGVTSFAAGRGCNRGMPGQQSQFYHFQIWIFMSTLLMLHVGNKSQFETWLEPSQTRLLAGCGGLAPLPL